MEKYNFREAPSSSSAASAAVSFRSDNQEMMMSEYFQQQQKFMEAIQSGMHHTVDPQMVVQLQQMYRSAQAQWKEIQDAADGGAASSEM